MITTIFNKTRRRKLRNKYIQIIDFLKIYKNWAATTRYLVGLLYSGSCCQYDQFTHPLPLLAGGELASHLILHALTSFKQNSASMIYIKLDLTVTSCPMSTRLKRKVKLQIKVSSRVTDRFFFISYNIMQVTMVGSPLRGHVNDSENEILSPPRIRTIYFLRQPVFRGQTWKRKM